MAFDLVCLQHRLPSTRLLWEGVLPDSRFNNIEVVGKPYSWIEGRMISNASRIKERRSIRDIDWNRLGRDVLVLDEGGQLHDAGITAGAWAGVEQTTSGLRSSWHLPTILVCRSAAKLHFESQIIARAIFRKLKSLGLLDGRSIGVLGLGALGSDILRQLVRSGLPAKGADRRPARGSLAAHSVPTEELVANSDVILGCTGTNVLHEFDLSRLSGRKVFASCSSSDVEFRSLLDRIPPDPPYGMARGIVGSADCMVLNGGYPINFDRVREWELFDEIVLTRRLCLEGLMQAASLVEGSPCGVMLDPAAQLRVVTEWLERVPDLDSLRQPATLDVNFFRTHSEGEFSMAHKPPYQLHSTTPGAVARMRAHREPYEVEVAGQPIIVLPDVWSPAYDWSSLFYVENFPDVSGRSFLEIGSGTGVIAVFAGLNGASRVVAIDVNEAAVRNTALNFERFKLSNADSFSSDGFAEIREKFDVIGWNAPYHGSRPADVLERGCADEDYRDIRAFFRDATSYLNPEGTVIFGFSESGDLLLIERLIAEAGFRVKQRLSDWRQDYNCMLFVLTPAARSNLDQASS